MIFHFNRDLDRIEIVRDANQKNPCTSFGGYISMNENIIKLERFWMHI